MIVSQYSMLCCVQGKLGQRQSSDEKQESGITGHVSPQFARLGPSEQARADGGAEKPSPAAGRAEGQQPCPLERRILHIIS